MVSRKVFAFMIALAVAGWAFAQTTNTDGNSTGKEVGENASFDETNSVETKLIVVAPNGKEVWPEASEQKISWKFVSGNNVSIAIDSLQISIFEVSSDETSQAEAVSIAMLKEVAYEGNWTWDSAKPAMEYCKIEVRAFLADKTEISDVSDEAFTISVPDPKLNSTSSKDKKVTTDKQKATK